MSSTIGFSSNSSNNQASNPLKLDAATREGLQAQNQARLLQSIGVMKKDEFNSVGGNGLNPLKSLYSAAAATFLKNKRGQEGDSLARKTNAQQASVAAVTKLAASSGSSSSVSFQQSNANVSGPASGGDYKKYAWNGNGVTGSETVKPEVIDPTDGQPQGDIKGVFNALSKVITDNDGSLGDNGDGTSSFKVLDLKGSLSLSDDTVSGTVTGSSGSYTFKLDEFGNARIDASAGDTSSAEYEQLSGLLTGSLKGVRRNDGSATVAAAEPVAADPPADTAPTTPPPADSGSTTPSSSDSGSSSSSSTTDSSSSSSSSSSTSAVSDTSGNAFAAGSLGAKMASLTKSQLTAMGTSSKDSDQGMYNGYVAAVDLYKAGAKFTASDSNSISFTLNGVSGTLSLDGDKVKGTYGTGGGAVKYEIRDDGHVKIEGDNNNAAATTNSRTFRAALGAYASGRTSQDLIVSKFNRHGSLLDILI